MMLLGKHKDMFYHSYNMEYITLNIFAEETHLHLSDLDNVNLHCIVKYPIFILYIYLTPTNTKLFQLTSNFLFTPN